MEDFAKIISAVAQLAWPVLIFYCVWRFASGFRDFIFSVSEGQLEGFGMKGSLKRTVTQEVLSAERTKLESSPAQAQMKVGSGKSVRLVDLLTSAIPLRELRGRKVLWVDDEPDNNRHETKALISLGLAVSSVISTEEALRSLGESSFDVVITDMRRGDNVRAGYELIDRLKHMNDWTPVIIYSSSNTVEEEEEALSRGAFGSTAEAADLILLVANAVRSAGKSDIYRDWQRWIRTRLPPDIN
jgi:CheY-like chemotaxis protein